MIIIYGCNQNRKNGQTHRAFDLFHATENFPSRKISGVQKKKFHLTMIFLPSAPPLEEAYPQYSRRPDPEYTAEAIPLGEGIGSDRSDQFEYIYDDNNTPLIIVDDSSRSRGTRTCLHNNFFCRPSLCKFFFYGVVDLVNFIAILWMWLGLPSNDSALGYESQGILPCFVVSHSLNFRNGTDATLGVPTEESMCYNSSARFNIALFVIIKIIEIITYSWAFVRAREEHKQQRLYLLHLDGGRRPRQNTLSSTREYNRILCDLSYGSWLFIFSFGSKVWDRAIKRYFREVYHRKDWTVGIISILYFLQISLTSYLLTVRLFQIFHGDLAMDIPIVIFLSAVIIKYFGWTLYDFTSTLARSDLRGREVLSLYCMGIFDFALIFINLFNLNLVRDDSMFALYPKARFCVYLVFGMDMFRWFVLTPCALIWVFGTDEEKNRATNRSFIHDMVSKLFHFSFFLLFYGQMSCV